MSQKKRIAVIAGDGIGQEVMPEGLRVMEAAASRFGIDLQFDHFDFSSWDYYEKHGQMLPDNWKEQIGGHDAIYFGAVGWPEKIADHVSLWGSLLLFRREFDQYINLRPARLMPGIIAPVVRRDGSAREPGEIDMYIVRENTEGEYSSIGGRMYPGTPREIVMQETVMSRHGVDRVLKFAFELAQSRPKKHLTSATKSNGIAITMPYWDERVAEMAKAYPDIRLDKFHIDILTAHFVQRPDFFDVVVASNLFGDILSDLGPACTGTIGIAPSANLNPDRTAPSLFEPVHGSAPDIAGQGIANPIGQIWCGAMMLEFLGHKDAHDAVLGAIEKVLAPGSGAPRTPDIGGKASTSDLGRARRSHSLSSGRLTDASKFSGRCRKRTWGLPALLSPGLDFVQSSSLTSLRQAPGPLPASRALRLVRVLDNLGTRTADNKKPGVCRAAFFGVSCLTGCC
ncbi:MAG: D-malate dehydrogenase [decarboxylating] [Paracidovorax wautersii]|uniref:D-malate dehydrogenase (decarboxylating) n=1 Tax=Paracidovorax wautersii TaxID=1177982 RepID=A0A7V8JS35_9BURK|nr:MAG: D-malate dehydrogenase [decarboxylating] [Paracidovorax wautersii]